MPSRAHTASGWCRSIILRCCVRTGPALGLSSLPTSRPVRPLVGHQATDAASGEKLAGDAAEDPFAETGVPVSAGDDEVGIEGLGASRDLIRGILGLDR